MCLPRGRKAARFTLRPMERRRRNASTCCSRRCTAISLLVYLALNYTVPWWWQKLDLNRFTKPPNPLCPLKSVKLQSIDLPLTYPLPTNVTGNEVTCEFDKDAPYWFHMPHTMQQLYRCVSFWNGRNVKVLNNPPPEADSHFVRGFMELLQDMGVEFRNDNDTTTTRFHPVRKDMGYQLHAPTDAVWLRQAAIQHLRTVYTSQCPAQPRVTILNREDESMQGRHLDDTDVWKSLLQPLMVTEVPSMDGKSFAEQVQIMADTDLLISPHGAQLTSIPFLPACAMVIELFPVGYIIPEFFGSLAVSSGHTHRYLYPSKELHATTGRTRTAARSRHVCIQPRALEQTIVPSIFELVEKEWRECCNRQQQQG